MKLSTYLFVAIAVASGTCTVAGSFCGRWKDWKDPLSEVELKSLMHKSYNVEKSLVERSRQARKPMESSVRIKKPISFLGRTFGEVRPVSTNTCRTGCSDIVSEYRQTYNLEERYFAFGQVQERISPCSHRLHTLNFYYRDYTYGVDGPSPLGRYRNGCDFLAEGRAIVADLEQRLGVPLQKLQLMSPIWPFRPGVKMSRAWSGSIPECYLCDEASWVTSRHAVATSNTNLGRVRVLLKLQITYYDEFLLTLSISDSVERTRCRDEYEKESRKKNHEPESKDLEYCEEVDI